MIHYINYMENNIEIWKDIPYYEGYYQVSNLGNVRSLNREVIYKDGRKYNYKSEIMKQTLADGYYGVRLCKNNKSKYFQTHQLVGMTFLGHIPDGHNFIIDHKEEGNRLDNRLENLQIITNRENITKSIDKMKTTSKYTGVCWDRKKWKVSIRIDGKSKHLGYFTDEYEAHMAYQNKLKEITK